MQDTVKNLLNKIMKDKARHRRGVAMLVVLALITSMVTTWAMHLEGNALAKMVACGKESHTHTEECYQKTLTCGQSDTGHVHSQENGCYTYEPVLTCEQVEHTHAEECYDTDGNLICETVEHAHDAACYTQELTLNCDISEEPEHVHTDACYTTELVCGKEEHTHDDTCYTDPNADVETADDWKETLPDEKDLNGEWAHDLLAVAESQLDYAESTANWQLGEDGVTHKGYTRYGAWYGVPYGDWCAMYVSFCLNYAGIPTEAIPYNASCPTWVDALKEMELFVAPEAEYVPQPGDLVFFDLNAEDGETIAQHAGIVKELDEEHQVLYVYEGNSNDKVQLMAYLLPGYVEPTEEEQKDIPAEERFHTPEVSLQMADDTLIGYASLTVAEETYHENYPDAGMSGIIDSAKPIELDGVTLGDDADNANGIAAQAVTLPTGSTKVNHTVTFKVMVNGQWQTLGSLPYYYQDGSDRFFITSDMAAQFFSAYGYNPSEDPGASIGHSFDDIYCIYYNDSNTYGWNINGGTQALNKDSPPTIMLYTLSDAENEIFRIRDAGDGKVYISPFAASNWYVDAVGNSSGNGTDVRMWYELGDGTKWEMVSAGGNKVKFRRPGSADAWIELSKGNQSNGGTVQIWNSSTNLWRLEKRNKIYNDGGASSITGGYKLNLGFRADGEVDYVCYYLPGYKNDSSAAGGKFEWEIQQDGNNFSNYSIRVVDSTNSVYSDAELATLTQSVGSGGTATVRVKNGENIIWSCVGKNGAEVTVEETQSNGYTTFVISNITQPIEVVATKSNPAFKVQYYANMPRYLLQDSGDLKVIDTSGGNLPTNARDSATNGSQLAFKWLQLNSTGTNTSENAGDATDMKEIASQNVLTQMYNDASYYYLNALTLKNVNKLRSNNGYTLAEIWILKEGRSDTNSLSRGDWDIYPANTDAVFTNTASAANGNSSILIQQDDVIRLVFDTTNGTFTNDKASLYDYDITDGPKDNVTVKGDNWTALDPQTSGKLYETHYTVPDSIGINSSSNYGTNSHSQQYNTTDNTFAFGNANSGTGLQENKFDSGYMNRNNGNSSTGCTFGMASSVNTSGQIVYNDWLIVPNLFNDGNAKGKHTYDNAVLTFDQKGETYTLSQVSHDATGSSQNLTKLFNPSPVSGTTHTHIFTNNFWPMDNVAVGNRKDPLFGKYSTYYNSLYDIWTNSNYDILYYYYRETDRNDSILGFQGSDDGNSHNYYFGMHFTIDFEVLADYIAPMEYLFFGDDDLWVFLTDQNNQNASLICDIGGVHSSVGEFVNLRDYIPVGSEGKYRLHFFYTERGASGSTCWMSFTLPGVTASAVEQEIGSLEISKTVDSTISSDLSKTFEFKVALKDSDGNSLTNRYNYSLSDGTLGQISDGGTISLQHGQTATISGLPVGTQWTVTETTDSDFTTTNSVNNGLVATGTIASGKLSEAGKTNTAAFTNTRKTTSVSLTKQVVGESGNDEFEFKFWVFDASWTNRTDLSFSYVKGSGSSTTSGTMSPGNDYQIKLKANETITFSGIPIGWHVEFWEKSNSNYSISMDTSQCDYYNTEGNSIRFNVRENGQNQAIFINTRLITITVTKTVNHDDIQVGYNAEDQDYYFQFWTMYGNTTGSGYNGHDGKAFADAQYTITNSAGQSVGTGVVDEHGIFSLKAGQTATFTGIMSEANKYVIAKELIPKSVAGNYHVSASATVAVDDTKNYGGENEPKNSDEKGPAETGLLETCWTYDSPHVELNNKANISFTHTNTLVPGSLKIAKTVSYYNGTGSSTAEFKMHVQINGADLPTGTPYTVSGETTERLSEADGVVKVPAGKTVTISNLMPGATFSVEEIDARSDYVATYTLNGQSFENTIPTGSIGTGTAVEIVVNNAERGTKVQIPLTKTISNPDNVERTFTFTLQQCNENGEPVQNGTQAVASINVASTATNNQAFTLQYVAKDYNNGDTLYYKITETSDNNGNIAYDTNYYIVKVVITKSTDGAFSAAATCLKNGTGGNTNVSFVNTLPVKLYVGKKIEGSTEGLDGDKDYYFQVRQTDRGATTNNTALFAKGTYHIYTYSDVNNAFTDTGETGAVDSKGTFTLKANQYACFETLFTEEKDFYVKEIFAADDNGLFSVQFKGAGERTQAGGPYYDQHIDPNHKETDQNCCVSYVSNRFSMNANTTTYITHVVNSVHATPILPETGGAGTKWYTFSGLLFMMAAAYVWRCRDWRGRAERRGKL